MKTQVYHKVGEFIKAREAHRNAPGRIVNGQMEVMVKGMWVSKEEFDAHNPFPVYQRPGKLGLDGKPTLRMFEL